MEKIIRMAECWEPVEIGYVSTFIELDRRTNEVLSISYGWNEKFSSDRAKLFNSFESLNTFIDELVAARNEAELNSLELQTYEG